MNGKIIYSTDTEDEAFKKMCGLTREEYEQREQYWRKEYERKENEHKAKIPQLTKEYRDKARGVVGECYLDLWDKIVPIRLGDLYKGMELECWLELIEILNDSNKSKDERFDCCRKAFGNQGHSGMSAGLVLSGICDLHDLGKEFKDYMVEHENL